jgi:hypothetical protein
LLVEIYRSLSVFAFFFVAPTIVGMVRVYQRKVGSQGYAALIEVRKGIPFGK